jgi:hypothetical protein
VAARLAAVPEGVARRRDHRALVLVPVARRRYARARTRSHAGDEQVIIWRLLFIYDKQERKPVEIYSLLLCIVCTYVCS